MKAEKKTPCIAVCRYCGERLTIPIGNHCLTCPKLGEKCKVVRLDEQADHS